MSIEMCMGCFIVVFWDGFEMFNSNDFLIKSKYMIHRYCAASLYAVLNRKSFRQKTLFKFVDSSHLGISSQGQMHGEQMKCHPKHSNSLNQLAIQWLRNHLRFCEIQCHLK